MTCRDAQELMLEAIPGRVAPDLRRALEAHLDACSSCRSRAAEMDETIAALRSVPEPPVPPGFWPAFMTALETRISAEGRSPLARFRRRLAPPAWAAAALSAAAVVAILISTVLSPVEINQSPPVPPAAVNQPISDVATEAMKAALPSLVQTAAIWQEGLGAPESDFFFEAPGESP